MENGRIETAEELKCKQHDTVTTCNYLLLLVINCYHFTNTHKIYILSAFIWLV